MTTATKTRKPAAKPARAARAKAAPPAPVRRPRGELDRLIMDYLRTRPGDDLGPYEVAAAISAKTGGVHPALERLTAQGLCVKTCTERPVRYRLAKKAAPRKAAVKKAQPRRASAKP